MEAGHPEAGMTELEARDLAVAVRDAHDLRAVGPGATAKNAGAVTYVRRGRTICRQRIRVSLFIVTILRPLPHVAVNVVEPESVWLKRADRHGLP